MYITHAKYDDLNTILEIYNHARRFMKAHRNPAQWIDGYPGKEVIEKDIKNNNCYVCMENDKIAGVFSFIIGDEPNYQIIEQGNWRSNDTYGTIHRLASDGQTKGIAKCCFDFCAKKCPYLRIDTHMDNQPMQGAILKYGFQKCGIIHVANGTERIAFDYLVNM